MGNLDFNKNFIVDSFYRIKDEHIGKFEKALGKLKDQAKKDGSGVITFQVFKREQNHTPKTNFFNDYNTLVIFDSKKNYEAFGNATKSIEDEIVGGGRDNPSTFKAGEGYLNGDYAFRYHILGEQAGVHSGERTTNPEREPKKQYVENRPHGEVNAYYNDYNPVLSK